MQLVKGVLRWSCISATLVLATLSNVSGQVAELTQAEYDLAVARFQTATDGIPHRETSQVQEFSSGRIIKRIEIVREWDQNGNYRILRTVLGGDHAIRLVRESIWIGRIEYVRRNNGPWDKTDWSKGGTGGEGYSPQDEKKYTREVSRDGSTATIVYTSRIIYKRESGKQIEVTRTVTNESHRRLRVEQVESLDVPENVVAKSITTFDYNPGRIQITAPID